MKRDPRERARRAFLLLSREHQEMVVMLQAEQLTYEQIGARLGIGTDEVERRVASTILAWCDACDEAARPAWRFW